MVVWLRWWWLRWWGAAVWRWLRWWWGCGVGGCGGGGCGSHSPYGGGSTLPHPMPPLHYTGWLLPHTRDFGGFATTRLSEGMHEVEFYKDKEGVVRALFRRHCLSSTYIPEGPGYPVFTSIPDGAPGLENLKADSAWNRTKVCSIIHPLHARLALISIPILVYSWLDLDL